MEMIATVLQANPRNLLVRNEENGQEVIVNYNNTDRFSYGDRIRITYNGAMTFSIPPQISATSIQFFNPVTPTSEMRAIILQRGRNFLIVRNIQSNQIFQVNFPLVSHFCIGQRVAIRYDTITLSNPPVINATDITPIC